MLLLLGWRHTRGEGLVLLVAQPQRAKARPFPSTPALGSGLSGFSSGPSADKNAIIYESYLQYVQADPRRVQNSVVASRGCPLEEGGLAPSPFAWLRRLKAFKVEGTRCQSLKVGYHHVSDDSCVDCSPVDRLVLSYPPKTLYPFMVLGSSVQNGKHRIARGFRAMHLYIHLFTLALKLRIPANYWVHLYRCRNCHQAGQNPGQKGQNSHGANAEAWFQAGDTLPMDTCDHRTSGLFLRPSSQGASGRSSHT